MPASLHALLAGVIDYAGLFPPARLPLEQAVQQFLSYSADPHHAMLARFVCPVAELKKATNLFDAANAPVSFAILGRGGDTYPAFIEGLRTDAESITAYQHQVFETRLPLEQSDFAWAVESATEFAKRLGTRTNQETMVFLEAPARDNAWSPARQDLVAELGSENRRVCFDRFPTNDATVDMLRSYSLGYKLRCGGADAAAIPSPEVVAAAIVACRNYGVPLKFTAGLHHPLRHRDAALQTRMHGFLNILVAGVLASARALSADQVQAILEDEDAASFRFDDAALHWKDLSATIPEIKVVRRHAVISFGSCSFEEPRDDLRRLGLLSQTP